MDIHDQEVALAAELSIPFRHVCVVGSTLICGGGQDMDFLCLVPHEGVLEQAGFHPDVEASYESPLRSYRRNSQNVIAVTDPSFFMAEVAIAHGARMIALNSYDMTQKEDRIRFHSAVREQVMQRMDDDEVDF